MKSAIPFIIIVAIAAAVATAMVLLSPDRGGTRGGAEPPPGGENPLEPSERVRDLRIPEFELIDQDGEPVTEEMLEGRVTIADFIFTHCPAICPMMTDRMELISGDLEGTPVQFVSFSMDPEHDTPERLREYAGIYDADLTRWTFITGDEATLRGIASDGLKFGITENPDDPVYLPDGTTMPNIIHGTWFALVGPDRQVLDLFQSTNERELQRLVTWATRAAEAAAKN